MASTEHAGPEPAPAPAGLTTDPPPVSRQAPAGDDTPWNTWWSFGTTTVVTAVTAFGEITLMGAIGWLTGLVFVIASLGSALAIRRRDLATAVIAPPLAFLLAISLAVQPSTLGATGNLVLQEASAIFTALAFNAPWVFAGTIGALAIVLIRTAILRRRDRAAHSA